MPPACYSFAFFNSSINFIRDHRAPPVLAIHYSWNSAEPDHKISNQRPALKIRLSKRRRRSRCPHLHVTFTRRFSNLTFIRPPFRSLFPPVERITSNSLASSWTSRVESNKRMTVRERGKGFRRAIFREEWMPEIRDGRGTTNDEAKSE